MWRKQVDNLLQKPMDRADFLKHAGMGLLVLVGLGSVTKLLAPAERLNSNEQLNGFGYGEMPYGGRKVS